MGIFRDDFRMIKVVLLFVFLIYANNTLAIKVSPSFFCCQGVEIGEDKDTGLDFVIGNDTEKKQEFTIEVIEPIMPKDESLKGYSKLPDLSWFYVEKTSLIIPAKGTGTSRIHIKIPKEDKYYNQHWVVSCHIKQKGKGFFTVAVAPFCMIETKAKENINEKPDGEIGIVPSIIKIKLEEVKNKKVSFKIYNNSPQECVYKIKSFVPDTRTSNVKINITNLFDWIDDVKWIKPSVDELKINGGENKEVEVEINLPEDIEIVEWKKGLETIIFVESESKKKGFVRLWIVQ